MAAAIQSALGVTVRITPGKVGQFEIRVDGKACWTKSGSRFPTDDEALEAVKGALG